MRVGIILAAIFFLLSSSASILAFTSKSDDGMPNPAQADTDVTNVEQPAASPDDNGCTTENESRPGYNRSVVRCRQDATSAPQSSSGPAAPSTPETPVAPQAQRDPAQPASPTEPQADAAPQQTNPGDADPACVTEEESGDGWYRATVRCNRRSESTGSSTSSSSAITSSSTVSSSSSTSNGTP
jgi:hypothetical protein